MDQIYSFKTKFIPDNLSVKKTQGVFYSEDDDNTTPNPIRIQGKPSKFLKIEYQTDESDETPKLSKSSPKSQNKLSKFQQLSPDLERETDVRFSCSEESDNEQQVIQQSPIENIDIHVQEQANQMEDKYKKPKQPFKNLHISKSSSSKSLGKTQNKLINHPFIHLIYGRSVDPQCFFKYIHLLQSGLVYALHSLKAPSDHFLKSRQVRLNEISLRKQYLILDLDETLIHSCSQRDNPQVKILAYSTDDLEEIEICFNVRPYCKEFLKEMSKFYTIYIFTASSDIYANAIINYLDPRRQYISDILSRQNCFETKNGFFIKDLRIICNAPLLRTLIVDNMPHSYGLQIENGVPILEWFQDIHDEELKYLGSYLIEASKQENMRSFNRDRMMLSKILELDLKN